MKTLVTLLLAALMIGGVACGGDPAPQMKGNDCALGAALPLAVSHLPGPPASEDFTFDEEGYLVALLGGHSLVRSARGAPPTLIIPNVVVTGRGLRVLPGGDFVIADRDRSVVVRVSASGDIRRLTTEIASPNGLELAPGGDLLVTNFGSGGEVYRVSPETGATSVLLRPGEGSNGLTFAPDGRRLYLGNHDSGIIQRVSFGGDGSADAPETWARGLVRPDGLASDSCGNVYAASWDHKLYRVNPAGKVDILAELPGPASAVQLGSGRQGWDARKLYVMAVDRGGVYEIDPAISAPPAPLVYRACPAARLVGGLKVAMTAELSAVSGSIAEAVVPSAVRDLVAEVDGCRLLRRRDLRCDPACAAGMTCGEGGQCSKYPDNLSAGTIRIEGLRRPVSMVPRSVGKLYWDSELPHPAWQPGADIRVMAAGAEIPAFSLRGFGVSPLEVPPQDWLLERDHSLTLSWTAGPEGPAKLVVSLQIDQHGRTPATLICESPDSGTFTVPAALINELLNAGTSGFPSVSLSRQTLDAVDLPPGCVELQVSAAVDRNLRVAGHLPCTRDAECPAGQRCQLDLQACR